MERAISLLPTWNSCGDGRQRDDDQEEVEGVQRPAQEARDEGGDVVARSRRLVGRGAGRRHPYFISRAISSKTSSMWSTSFCVCRAETVHCSS